MRIPRILAAVLILAAVFSCTVFAAPQKPGKQNNTKQEKQEEMQLHEGTQKQHDTQKQKHTKEQENTQNRKYKHGKFYRHEKSNDPIKILERKKEQIDQLVREGRMTQEMAEKIKAKIDARIREIEEFDRLSPEQKKEKLMQKYKEYLDRKVRSGHLSKEKADEMFEEFRKKIQEWDGKGYPFLKGRDFTKLPKPSTAKPPVPQSPKPSASLKSKTA